MLEFQDYPVLKDLVINQKEFLCLSLDKSKEIIEVCGSKLGMDFLLQNPDIKEKFLQFYVEGSYKASVTKVVSYESGSSIEEIEGNSMTIKRNDIMREEHNQYATTSSQNNKRNDVSQCTKRRSKVLKRTVQRIQKKVKNCNMNQMSSHELDIPVGYTINKKGKHNKQDCATVVEKVELSDHTKEIDNKHFTDHRSMNKVDKKYQEDETIEDGIEQIKDKETLRPKTDINSKDLSPCTQICDVCGKSFSSFAAMSKHHAKDHTHSKHFPCQNCKRIFTTKGGWLQHNILIHNKYVEKLLKCPWCELKMVNRYRYNQHVKNCQVSYIHNCNKCDKKFKTFSAVELHTRLEHSSVEVMKRLKCSVCDEVFGTEESRKNHEGCHDNTDNQCSTCKQWFLSSESRERHEKCHSESHMGEGKEQVCPYCNRVYKQKVAFIKHVDLHKSTNLGEKFECPVCRKECKSASTYKLHMRQHLPNEEKPYKCSICRKGYGTNKGLMIHEKSHSDKMYVFCEICGKGFKEQRQLKVHVRRVHTKERPYKCEFCNKTFITTGGRREHITSVHQTKSIMCEQCGKICPSRARLAAHQRLHYPSVRIECEVCKRVFNKKVLYLTHYVAVHLALEDVDKFPYKVHVCPQCNKLFFCAAKLQTHIRTHTGEKPEICEYCDKRFSDRANLLAHIKIHKDDKPHHCDICYKRFIHKRALRKHIEAHDIGLIPNTQEINNKSNEEVQKHTQKEAYSRMEGELLTEDHNMPVGVQYMPDTGVHIIWNDHVAQENETHMPTQHLQCVMQQ